MEMTKRQKLKELVDELIVNTVKEDEIPFNYQLCPYFDDCSAKVTKICIEDYKSCFYYKHRKILN